MSWKRMVKERAEAQGKMERVAREMRARALAEVEAGRSQAEIAREIGVKRQRLGQMIERAREERGKAVA